MRCRARVASLRDGPKDPLTFGSGARATVLDRSGFGFTKLAVGVCDGPLDYLGFPCLGTLPPIDRGGKHGRPSGVPRSREFLSSGAASSERCYGIEKVHHVGLGGGAGFYVNVRRVELGKEFDNAVQPPSHYRCSGRSCKDTRRVQHEVPGSANIVGDHRVGDPGPSDTFKGGDERSGRARDFRPHRASCRMEFGNGFVFHGDEAA